jgi:hypothetical protein
MMALFAQPLPILQSGVSIRKLCLQLDLDLSVGNLSLQLRDDGTVRFTQPLLILQSGVSIRKLCLQLGDGGTVRVV